MNIQRIIFAAVVAVVFLFAGYNLYNYFSNQSEIQAQKDREAQELVLERERRKTANAEAKREAAAERKRKQQKEERLAAERRAKQQAKRQAEAEEREARRLERIAREKKRDEERLQARIQEARTPRHIEGIPQETIEKLNSVAARYIRDNPTEFSNQTFHQKSFGRYTKFRRLLRENTNTLMLYAAISQDTNILQALLDIGLDINSANKAGYTPLMFAAAYNSPEVVKFLIGKGADTSVKANIQDLNALHIASLFNPRPDIIDVLLVAGMNIEAKTENDHTPLLLAASDNRNLEVVERLAFKGADKGAYDAKGRTAVKIVEARIGGEGDEYFRISDEMNKQVINSVR